MKFLALLGLAAAAGEDERCADSTECDGELVCGYLTYDGIAKPAQEDLEGENFEILATAYSTHYGLDPREVFVAADESAVTDAEWATAMGKLTAASAENESYCGEATHCGNEDSAREAAEEWYAEGMSVGCHGMDLEGAVDAVADAAQCALDHALDPEAAAECVKWAGKDCEAEEDEAEKEACEAAQGSAKALAAGAIALVAAAALM